MAESIFRGPPATMPIEPRSNPIFQWANKVNEVVGRNKVTSYSGWLSEANKNEEFDMAMEAAGFVTVTIKHSNGEEVTHWKVPVGTFVPIMTQVDTLGSIKTSDDRHGMAIGWRQTLDGRGQSFTRFMAIFTPIFPAYVEPVMITVKSRTTGDIVGALMRQYELLDWIAKSRKDRNLAPKSYPFYAVLLEIGAGAEDIRGTTVTANVIPPVNMAPDPLTKEYVLKVFLGTSEHQDLINLVESHLDEVIEWSLHESRPTAPVPMQENTDGTATQRTPVRS